MKYFNPIGIIAILALFFFSFINEKNELTSEASTKSLYDQKINDIDGKPINLNDFKGKKILFVNVASKCGFTPQYAELQKLHEAYNEKLVIIGLPCNQFGSQEPGTGEEIKSFCQKNYGVEFLITEKIDVKGKNQHMIYNWLTSKAINGKMDSNVKWNFTKYLVNEQGELMEQFSSSVKPMSDKITSQL